MGDGVMARTFRIAPMSPTVMALTLLLLGLPPAFLVASFLGTCLLTIPALLIIAVYAWVWLRFRPARFVVHPGGLEVIWPLKRRTIPRDGILSVRAMDRQDLKKEIGWGVRVGAGGLWGGFGWLWTKRRGLVQMYVSRTDRFVWIECIGSRPWLITPERPEDLVRELSSRIVPS